MKPKAQWFSRYKTKFCTNNFQWQGLEASHRVHGITGNSYDTNSLPLIPYMLLLMASFAPVCCIACIYNLATSDSTKQESKIFKKKLSIVNT